MAEQPDNVVLRHLRGLRVDFAEMKAELKGVREKMAIKADFRADLNSLRADVASDLLEVRNEIAGLRMETRERS